MGRGYNTVLAYGAIVPYTTMREYYIRNHEDEDEPKRYDVVTYTEELADKFDVRFFFEGQNMNTCDDGFVCCDDNFTFINSNGSCGSHKVLNVEMLNAEQIHNMERFLMKMKVSLAIKLYTYSYEAI